jgi:ribosomal-protein-alanine N-acetyltransferase
MIQLVEAHSGDLDAVMAIMKAAFDDRYGEAWTRSQCAGILPMHGVKLVVAYEQAMKPCGFALYRAIAGDAELLLLAVSSESQGRGVGRLLLNRFIEEANRDGANRVHLEVREGNPAIGLYRSAGFAPAGRRRNYYRGANGEQHDAITFVLNLDT